MRKWMHWTAAAGALALCAALATPSVFADGPEKKGAAEAEDSKAKPKGKDKDGDTAEAPSEKDKPAPPKLGAAIGNRVPHFKVDTLTYAKDGAVEGKHDSHALKHVTVYVFNSKNCPFIGFYKDRIVALEKAYAEKGVEFVHLYANRTETDDDKKGAHKENGFQGPMVLDTGAKVAGKLKGKRTPELVACGKDGVIFYRGGIDDDGRGANIKNRYAAQALDQFLAGKKVEVTTSKPIG